MIFPEPSHLSLHPVEDSIGFDSEPATTVIDQRTEVVDASKETGNALKNTVNAEGK